MYYIPSGSSHKHDSVVQRLAGPSCAAGGGHSSLVVPLTDLFSLLTNIAFFGVVPPGPALDQVTGVLSSRLDFEERLRAVRSHIHALHRSTISRDIWPCRRADSQQDGGDAPHVAHRQPKRQGAFRYQLPGSYRTRHLGKQRASPGTLTYIWLLRI
jgi:hypothetical protein